MVTIEFAFIIFALCMTGCAAVSWRLGKTAGAEDTLQFLIDEGIITIDFEDEDS